MTTRFITAILLTVAVQGIAHCQNLVLNSSFEESNPQRVDTVASLYDLDHCFNSNEASPEILTPSSKSRAFVSPVNQFGFQKPHSGNTYVGMLLYNFTKSTLRNKYREYVSMELKEPLKPKALYCISMYVSLANNCKYACDGFGVYLSGENIKSAGTYLLKTPTYTEIVPYKYDIAGYVVKDTLNWLRICDYIVARGGEKVITIGNFKSDDYTKYVSINNKRASNNIENSAYYYLDDVSVTPFEGTGCNCPGATIVSSHTTLPQPPAKPETSKPMILDQLFFELGHSLILPSMYGYLDSLCNRLRDSSQLVEIHGHTDNLGSETSNQKLSTDRARAIMKYMIAHGVTASRLSATGHGSSQPLAPNDCEANRARNRRVDFIIKTK